MTGFTAGYDEAPNYNWTGYVAEEGKELQLVSKKDIQVWNYITQSKSSEISQNMYKDATTFKSDLVNSYAWDTAIVFIQTFSSEPDASNYANLDKTTSLSNTGINTDKYCNIHDMSGNAIEWSTESNTYPMWFKPCVLRGGAGAGIRESVEEDQCWNYTSFRPILYIAQ